MMTLSDERHKRGLALALLLFAATLGGLLLIAPLLSAFSEQKDRLDQAVVRLATYEAQKERIPRLKTHLAVLKAQGATSSGLLTDKTSALAAASVQTRLRPVFDRDRAELRSVQNLRPTTKDGFERVPIQYVFAVPEDGLGTLLHALETTSPYLFLDDVSIRRPENAAISEDGVSLPPLDVRWTVSGYRWTDGK